MILAAAGFLIAVIIWTYSKLADSSPPHFNLPLWATFTVLCPPSLLSAPLIDIEPASSGFTTMWLVIGLLNSALYAVIGMLVGKFRWKPDNKTVLAGSGS
jgi:hypothetical protein